MKIRRSGEGSYSPRPASSVIAREKAIDKGKIRAFPLTCGHLTDWEIAQVYDNFKPLGKLAFYCEQCGDWRYRAPKQERIELPKEPMF